MSKLFLGVLICLSVVATKAAWPEIVGDAEFTNAVRASLQLLQDKAKPELDFISYYVKRIQMHEKSGMCAYCNPPTFQVSKKYIEKYWLASIICHDGYHSYLYHDYLYKHPGTQYPPADAWTGVAAEQQCNKFQLQVLRKIGAPKHYIDQMEKEDGTHCDLNGDGKCDEKDYELRNYNLLTCDFNGDGVCDEKDKQLVGFDVGDQCDINGDGVCDDKDVQLRKYNLVKDFLVEESL